MLATLSIKSLPETSKCTDVQLRCPSDKSLTHRLLIFAAMAHGQSEIFAPLDGEDCRATAQAMRALGVELTESANSWCIQSPGWDAWKSPAEALDFANSGTTTRLLLGVFAATPGLNVECFGDASLSKRPMLRLVNPLRALGAKISGDAGGNLLPLAVEGCQLSSGRTVFTQASAQLKSALLLAGLNINGETTVELPTGSRDHTELLLQYFGASLDVKRDGVVESLRLRGPFRPTNFSVRVPSDPSSAAFFAVLAALRKDLQINLPEVMSNPTRTGFIAKMHQAGCHIQLLSESSLHSFCEPVVALQCRGGVAFSAFDIAATEVPSLLDEVPILAILAAFAKGRSHFKGLSELRVKESDRLAKIGELLSVGGVPNVIKDDELIVEGQGIDFKPRGFNFDASNDHRLAMAAAVFACKSDGDVRITNADCVAVSFPTFYDFLNKCNVATFH